MDLKLESSSKKIQVRKGSICFSNQPRFVNCNLQSDLGIWNFSCTKNMSKLTMTLFFKTSSELLFFCLEMNMS